ncbi:MAG: tRNA (adenosine(37)-N6)-dimethylallyltransferase MiaA [Rhodospirillaceae bacterium]|nr:tRNA (adenosine(37)-N6)-dimethylallyltransferase MiaA [Rhodospirillaceae bacterium]
MSAPAARPAQNPDGQTKIVVIGGPTAGGKSEIALQIAREFGGAVINADSMQVYQELKIVTARPDDAALSAAPHRLYGVLPARERCSAGRWRRMALDEIAGALEAGLLPVVVGGTGLYLKALLDGIATIPDIPEERVQSVTAWLDEAGLEAGRARLRAVDPATAGRLDAIDRQRLIRALSVFEDTGRPLSDWSGQSPQAPPFSAFKIALMPPREDLYPRIDARFARMIDRGALDEARRLSALQLAPSLPAMKAVGVPQMLAHLRGETGRAAMIVEGQTATRRFAKRQFTWFRRQYRSPDAVLTQYSESIRDELFNKIRQFQLTA